MKRRSLWALGVCGALGLAGCDREQSALPVNKAGTSQIVVAPPEPPPDAQAKKEADGPPIQPKAHLDVAMADLAAAEAASPKWNPAQAQEVRNNARILYQRAIATDPKHLPAYHGLARLYVAMDDLDHAAATYEKALKAYPADPKVCYELGMVHARTHRWDAAVEQLGRAADLDPENRRYAHMLGFTHARAGRPAEALAAFARVDGEAKAHYQLARMLEHVNETGRAKEHLQKSLELNPRLDAARELLARLENPDPAAGGLKTVGHQQAADEDFPMAVEVPIPAREVPMPPAEEPRE